MSSEVTIYINDVPHKVPAGRTLVSVLWDLGRVPFRVNPISGSPRAPFCGMGACFECEADVEGYADKRTCLIEVREGLRVRVEEGALHEQ